MDEVILQVAAIDIMELHDVISHHQLSRQLLDLQ